MWNLERRRPHAPAEKAAWPSCHEAAIEAILSVTKLKEVPEDMLRPLDSKKGGCLHFAQGYTRTLLPACRSPWVLLPFAAPAMPSKTDQVVLPCGKELQLHAKQELPRPRNKHVPSTCKACVHCGTPQ